jgi:hypothetical protein
MLGFGVVTGAAASNPARALSALRRGPLTLLMPAHPPAPIPLAAAPPIAEATSIPETPAPPPASAESPAPAPASAPAKGHKKSAPKAAPKKSSLPPIKHVFLIVLADQPYAQTFGPESPAPYLSHTLERRGELLVRYYAVAREELANEVALISGLGPTPQTAADCPIFNDIVPAVAGKDGQYSGQGCVYPSAAQTVGDQLAAKGLTWRVYAEGMNDGGPAACRHPAFGAPDPTSQAPSGDTFATFRDPFSYFDSVIDSPSCAHEDMGLEGLSKDLKDPRRTPTLSYIVPDLCHDGRPTPCAPGAQSGLPAADAFLHHVVPEILAAPAYRSGGLLIVTTDQAPATGLYGDSSSCCMQPRFPVPPVQSPSVTSPSGSSEAAGASPGSATAQPGVPGAATTQTTTTQTTAMQPAATQPATTQPAGTQPATTQPAGTQTTTTQPAGTQTTTLTATTPPAATQPAVELPPSGGGQVGALLLSPYVKPGTTDQEPFNHFSLLRTIENLFGLPHLGYAALRGLSSLEASVFSAYTGG